MRFDRTIAENPTGTEKGVTLKFPDALGLRVGTHI
jgi:hypothetical protein